jgi:hypothetical protein
LKQKSNGKTNSNHSTSKSKGEWIWAAGIFHDRTTNWGKKGQPGRSPPAHETEQENEDVTANRRPIELMRGHRNCWRKKETGERDLTGGTVAHERETSRPDRRTQRSWRGNEIRRREKSLRDTCLSTKTKLHGRQTKRKPRHAWAKIKEVTGAKLMQRRNLRGNEKHWWGQVGPGTETHPAGKQAGSEIRAGVEGLFGVTRNQSRAAELGCGKQIARTKKRASFGQ